MKRVIVFALICSLIILAGCKTAEDVANSYNNPESSFPVVSNEVQVEEEVVVPAHEPEDSFELEVASSDETENTELEIESPTEIPTTLLDDRKDTDFFLHGRPDAGQSIDNILRKVTVVFSYPVGTDTVIEVWDKDETVQFDKEDTFVDYETGVVATVYVNSMPPGIYKVKYHADFVGKKNEAQDGYYHFEVK